MTNNPYDAPRADLTTPELLQRRARLKAWLWDRLVLWLVATALCVVLPCGMAMLLIAMEWLGLIPRRTR